LPRSQSKCTAPALPNSPSKRHNARATHPVHVVTTLQPEAMAEYDRPVGIGTLITVDTTLTVDVKAVASAVRDCYDRVINLR
jgi:hypothetical protein